MHWMTHGHEVNLLIIGPGILDSGPVKAVSRMRQHRRNTSAATAYINKVLILYMMEVYGEEELTVVLIFWV